VQAGSSDFVPTDQGRAVLDVRMMRGVVFDGDIATLDKAVSPKPLRKAVSRGNRL
jgi:hypothetical protein